ncbi:ATP-binding protein [Pseudoxanthomonas yeongjuensis]|uniref:ATP-binding protein n=1 Tax=Pseudoxanthomonas yeongjuensis TaxID=377616 RepID=UPI001390DF8F|nr:ATP-binding protein [Pseudoxanthomonas yeongjuensis]
MKDTPGWANDCYITVHDDDDSPFEGVVELLRRCVGFGLDNAQGWARQISRSGSARLGPWTSAIAHSIRDEMARLAPTYGCRKLRVALEDQSEQAAPAMTSLAQKAHHVLSELFGEWPADSLVIVRREFPAYLRVDVQSALDSLTTGARRVGIHSRNRYDASDMAALISERDQAKLVGALQFEDIDIGEGQPIRLATNCLSLINDEKVPLAVWVNLRSDYSESLQLSVEVLAPPGEEAAARTVAMLEAIEAAVAQGRSYRGKILSLEANETFRGTAANALTVHFRTPVAEHELILPDVVKNALDRHIIRFAAERDALKSLGQSGRKGVLLYGPPGTGKTHTIRYLAERLHDHTTFLVTAEQIGLIAVYFRLARLFAPSIIVIEDADLIARQREDMNSACDEVMLNRLLNEMDGLRSDADIFVVMTTNRPRTLETALIQRPGRIDHAIEVPVPDAVCRGRLLHLYGGSLAIQPKEHEKLIERTEGVSAAFIKEVARRLAQQSISARHPGQIDADDLEVVLEEMLSERDGLNLRLLGGDVEAIAQPG